MNYDEDYKPDRRIHDIYEDNWAAKRLEDIGLPPYARIGSLSDQPVAATLKADRWLNLNFNLHKFTFISPLRGETLSPLERRVYFPRFNRSKFKLNAAEVIGPRPIPGREKILAKSWTLPVRQTLMAALVTLFSVGLIVYAAAFEPISSSQNTQPTSPAHPNNNPYAPPLILDNKSNYPLQTLLEGKQLNNSNSSGASGPLSSGGEPSQESSGSGYYQSPSTSGSAPTSNYAPPSGSTAPSIQSSTPSATPSGSSGGASSSSAPSSGGSNSILPSLPSPLPNVNLPGTSL